MIEVFKTDITEPKVAKELSKKIKLLFPSAQINFDLDDCDRILRIENDIIPAEEIENIVTRSGFKCRVLD